MLMLIMILITILRLLSLVMIIMIKKNYYIYNYDVKNNNKHRIGIVVNNIASQWYFDNNNVLLL